MLKDSNTCFACGKRNPYGLRLDIRQTEDGSKLTFQAAAHYAGWEGIVHGGIVSTLLDELLAWACTARGVEAVTAELTVRFRQPIRTGQTITGTGRILSERGRLLIGRSSLVNADGRLVAEATGKMMRT